MWISKYFQSRAGRFNTFLSLPLHFLCLQIWMNVTLTMLPRKMKGLSASTSVTTMWVATSVLAGLATSFRVTTTPAKVKIILKDQRVPEKEPIIQEGWEK